MTKFYVHIAETAEHDIDETLGYLIAIKHNPTAALILLEEIEKKKKTISDFPLKYQTVDDPFLAFFGIRCMPVKNYFAFYIVDGNNIYIIRFLHQKQNWKSILKTEFPTFSGQRS